LLISGFILIPFPSLSKPGADDANPFGPKRVVDAQNASLDGSPDTKIALFIVAVPPVWGLNAPRIPEDGAGFLEGYLVFFQV
jgi:hypothetical protein